MVHKKSETKILLGLLPFWDPQIPPLGIGCLTSYLRQRGYLVKGIDANLEVRFRELYDGYYKILQEIIPPGKQGNIFNIGNQVLRGHLMSHYQAHFLGIKPQKYDDMLEELIGKTFFTPVNRVQTAPLVNIAGEFFTRLKSYVLDLLEKEKPTVLGLSVYGDTFPASLAAFGWAKEFDPNIKTIMGGGIFADQLAPGSPELEYFVELSKNTIDIMIIGEGEELFYRYLEGKLPGGQRVYGLADLLEIAGREREGNQPGSPGNLTSDGYIDIDTVDIPDYTDFALQYYPHIAHYGARSCPFQCKFCSETINWGKYRRKDIQRTVQELIALYKRHSCQLYLLTDSTLNPIISALSEAFIASGVTIYWDGFLRADPHASKTENTLLWRRGGFYRAKLGLESGSQRVLDLMNKGIKIKNSEASLAALSYAGVKTTTFWLFGFPGETEEDFQATLDFLERNKDRIYEADCNAFNYYLTGQANSEEWLKKNKGILLYPEWARELLVTRTWILEGIPTREEAYERVNRFVEFCKRLGIPNPYSLSDVYKADERWCKLHPNAVPPLVELENRDQYVDDTKNVKDLSFAQNKLQDDEDWF